MTDRIIDVSNLHVRFGDKKILKDVSLFLNRGEILGVIGESGSGKTTLGKTVLSLVEKAKGRIDIHTREKKKVQMIFQNPYSSLDPKMNIMKILTLGMKINGLHRGKEHERAMELLNMCGLSEDFLYRYPGELSGGQKQRVGIARALSTDPEVLIADEPTSALDVTVQLQILELMKELKEKLNLSIIFISHDLKIVKKLCDRVYILYLGEIIEKGTAEEIFTSPQTEYTKKLIEAIPITHPRDRVR